MDVGDSGMPTAKAAEVRFDGLTGLPNRLLFADRLNHILLVSERYGGKAAVVLVGLDRLPVVYDSLGTDAGNTLVQLCAERIAASTRRSDSAGRLGADLFGLILPQVGDAQEAGHLARSLLARLGEPFRVMDQEILVGGSVGIALFPDDAADAEALLRCADAALQRAREEGRHAYQYYSPAMTQRAMEHMRLEADLRRAIAAGEFELYYQPKVSCGSGEIVGMEALLRWNRPGLGLAMPGDFVPLLEETGLINQVGEWAIETACRQVKQWMEAGLGKPAVAVNLSARQLADSDLLGVVEGILARLDFPADRLELELTESVLMHNVQQIIPVLAGLRQLGVRLSVDDFGTGYSSLSYLKRFPLDAVKVDRSFVQDITADPDDASITRAVINMAHNLKLKVVAEGVESQGQLTLLVANQCDEIQGYYFSRPVPAAEMERMLAEGRAVPADVLRPGKRQRTVLLVDDEENILAALRRLLRRDGYRILTAGGGDEGLQVLAQNEVDVIISDQRMPNMTGVEFLRRVKTIHPHTIRMVLSGYTELQSITDAINEGAIYKFLTKPWEDEHLRKTIEEALQQKELADENRRLHQELQAANRDLAESN